MKLFKSMEKELFAFVTKLAGIQTGAPPEINIKIDDCESPELGKWINSCDFSLLIDSLQLSEAVFTQEFPAVNLSLAERKDIANALEAHCESCARCREKRADDLAWKSSFETALKENRDSVRKVLARAVGKK